MVNEQNGVLISGLMQLTKTVGGVGIGFLHIRQT
jgi:hypothetical protein